MKTKFLFLILIFSNFLLHGMSLGHEAMAILEVACKKGFNLVDIDQLKKVNHAKLLKYITTFKENGCSCNRCHSNLDITWHWMGSPVLEKMCGLEKNGLTDCPLIEAINLGFEDIVESLLKWGDSPNRYSCYFDKEASALYIAASLNRANIVKKLLDRGADDPFRYHYVRDPIEIARVKGHKDVLEVFDDWQNKDKNSLRLFEAIEENDLLKLQFFLKKHFIKPNVTNKDGETPLHVAIRLYNFEAIRYLLSYGADITIKNKNKQTPVDYAPMRQDALPILFEALRPMRVFFMSLGHRNLAYLKDFCDRGLLFDFEKYKKLHYKLLLEWTKFLIHNKTPDVFLSDFADHPLIEAINFGFEDIVQLLLQNGADPNVKSGFDSQASALYLAVFFANANIVKMLVSAGANVNPDGKSPMQLAQEKNDQKIISILNGPENSVSGGIFNFFNRFYLLPSQNS
ncbi:ankyrin repeat domain-containing protein [Candidatus Dependentiae bacterium]|nr:ankyrin repeat domain-containing protein [Candidatus Dependentiae bacterium]